MKIGIVIICLLLTGILGLEIEARQDRVRAAELAFPPTKATSSTSVAKNAPPTTTPAAKPPILVQASLFQYGENNGSVGFEGKIYNPNQFPLTSVIVSWQVYSTPDEKAAQQFKKFRFEESCGVYFAYIPPLTTYDYKTSKIKERSFDAVDSLGLDASYSKMTDLTPKIDFSTER